MSEGWDDRCVQVMPNIGITVQDAFVRGVQSMKNDEMRCNARIAELEQENRELLAKCEKYECEIGLSKQRIAALESKSNMYIDLAVAMASAAREVDSLEKERDRMREALAEAVEKYGKPGGPWNIPGEPGSWIAKAREALKGTEE